MTRVGNLKEISIFCLIILQEQRFKMRIHTILKQIMRTQNFRLMYKDMTPIAELI
jgi:hypothetical protein